MSQIVNNFLPYKGNIQAHPCADRFLTMTNEEYYSDIWYLSHHLLKEAWKNPELFGHILAGWRDPSKDTDSINFGSLVHTMFLQPEKFDEQYILLDDGPIIEQIMHEKPQTKMPTMTNDYKNWKAEVERQAQRQGKTIALKEHFDTAQKMVEVLDKIPIIHQITDGTIREQVVSRTEMKYNMLIKGMIDILGNDYVVDYKTVGRRTSLNVHDVYNWIREMDYHAQVANYALTAGVKKAYIIFQWTEFPYTVLLVKFSDQLMEEGLRRHYELIDNVLANFEMKNRTSLHKPFYLEIEI